MDLAPENLCCFENDSPIGVDPVINITDRSQRPIATQLSIPFTPSLTEGSLMCNFSSGSWTVNLMCYYSISGKQKFTLLFIIIINYTVFKLLV